MLKGLGDVGQMMKLQKEMKSTQKKLKKKEIEGKSKDGYVKAIVNGEFRLLDLKIDPEILENSDQNKLEGSIISAVNTAIDSSKEHAANEMSKLTGGMNIPGLGSMLK